MARTNPAEDVASLVSNSIYGKGHTYEFWIRWIAESQITLWAGFEREHGATWNGYIAFKAVGGSHYCETHDGGALEQTNITGNNWESNYRGFRIDWQHSEPGKIKFYTNISGSWELKANHTSQVPDKDMMFFIEIYRNNLASARLTYVLLDILRLAVYP
jgi:hypothetical protein